jgi:enoyl-[acyl-carrier protein] reductase/trans-2-enoyl-CoA reductase (NAD+)
MRRLFAEHLADGKDGPGDAEGRIRLDDREMRPDVQAEVLEQWSKITTENLRALTDFAGFQREFRSLFGFEVEGVDYDQPVETEVSW